MVVEAETKVDTMVIQMAMSHHGVLTTPRVQLDRLVLPLKEILPATMVSIFSLDKKKYDSRWA